MMRGDDTYATTSVDDAAQSYGTFGFDLPSGNEVTGVLVKYEAAVSSLGRSALDIALSWDGGATFTDTQRMGVSVTSDTIYSLGGESDDWGRAWSPEDFADGNFKVRIIASTDGEVIHLDALQVRPYHQSTGGGTGGGAL